MSRAVTSIGILVASPQMAENSMNRQIEVTKVRTSPKRRPIHPVNGCMTAAASMYELTAHVPSALLTPRLPAMEGTETLTMVMSRSSMKEAVAIAAVRNNSLLPRSGGYSNAAGVWGASGTGLPASLLRRDCAGPRHPPRHSLFRGLGYTPACRPPVDPPLASPAPDRLRSRCPP